MAKSGLMHRCKGSALKRRARAFVLGVGLVVTGDAAMAQEVPLSVPRVVSLDRLTRPSQPLASYTIARITEVASEIGFSVSVAAVEGDYPVLILRDENRASFVVQPMVCTGTDAQDSCSGLLLVVGLQGAIDYPGISLAQINRFNDLQFYGRGHVAPGSLGVLSRLALSDFGTTRGNLAVELFTFRSAMYSFSSYLSAVRVAASASQGSGSFLAPGRDTQSFVVPNASQGPADFSAPLPRLIERWEKAGLLDEISFPPESLKNAP